jgi:hypothetical protein
MMQPYRDLSGTSGVQSYEYGDDWIRVRFRLGDAYVYDYASTGLHHVERMKELARLGRGLSTYISQHVRDAYARKEHLGLSTGHDGGTHDATDTRST